MTPLPRRWFRYSLRTLFVLVTVFCIWLGVQVKWIGDRHEALQWLRQQRDDTNGTGFLYYSVWKDASRTEMVADGSGNISLALSSTHATHLVVCACWASKA